MSCRFHDAVTAGLRDLAHRGVISPETEALASASARRDCEYTIVRKDEQGCVVTHP